MCIQYVLFVGICTLVRGYQIHGSLDGGGKVNLQGVILGPSSGTWVPGVGKSWPTPKWAGCCWSTSSTGTDWHKAVSISWKPCSDSTLNSTLQWCWRKARVGLCIGKGGRLWWEGGTGAGAGSTLAEDGNLRILNHSWTQSCGLSPWTLILWIKADLHRLLASTCLSRLPE